MQGKIIKGIAGFYYVHVPERGTYECKAKGSFRNQKIKPMVGDNVKIDIIDEAEKKGNIVSILPRLNALIRPAVSNIDQALIIFAVAEPKPNFGLLDRFLVMMARQHIPAVICFNKEDIGSGTQTEALAQMYAGCGSLVLFASVKEQAGIDAIRKVLCKKTTVLAGPSGVGKSSLMNLLNPEAKMQTGAVSEKIKRGRHTTRHSEIFYLGSDSYLMDTPGFTSLNIQDMEKEELKAYFSEFAPYEGKCRFHGCVHISEPDCRVKKALEDGEISRQRYESYVQMFEELKNQRRY